MGLRRMSNKAVLVAAVVGWVTPAFGAPGFQGLGSLWDLLPESEAFSVSSDGSVVVGWSICSEGVLQAFRWTESSGMEGLGYLVGGSLPSKAAGISADGSVIVGWSTSSQGLEAFRRTTEGMVGLGDLDDGDFLSQAFDVSADGSIVVGRGSSSRGVEAFRWENDVMSPLGDLGAAPDDFESWAQGVSADGAVVVGEASSALGDQAFRWTVTESMVGLGDLEGGSFSSEARAASADGTVIVGSGTSANGREAFRWENDVMTGLGDLPGGDFHSWADAVSADGSVIVGSGRTDAGVEAFIWDTDNGMRNLRNVLADDYCLDLTGWTLEQAKGISVSGSTLAIVGWGINADGDTEAWIAWLTDTDGNGVGDACELPAVSSAVSSKTHDTAGDFDVDLLNPLPGSSYPDAIECRLDGPTKIVVEFNELIYGTGGMDLTDVSLNSGTVSNLTINDNVLTIEMSGADDVANLTIDFDPAPDAGIEDASGNPVTETLCFGVFLGDVNGDGMVNLLDMADVRDEMDQSATMDNFRIDAHVDGLINLLDMSKVRYNMNQTIGVPCP